MRIKLLFSIILCGLFYFGGCAQTVERIGPQGVQVFGDPYFRPKRVYAVQVNEAWDLTIKALNREGISLEMVNKETGLIRTDYQNLSAWERGKCDLRFPPEPQHQTFIYIRCTYEGRKEATEPFRDFTYSSPQEAMKAEKVCPNCGEVLDDEMLVSRVCEHCGAGFEKWELDGEDPDEEEDDLEDGDPEEEDDEESDEDEEDDEDDDKTPKKKGKGL